MSGGLPPIDDEEFLYRRVSATANPVWYDPGSNSLSDQAFAPHKTADVTGLSLWRAKFKPIDDLGKPGKRYYVAVLTAGAIRQAGMRVEPRPDLPTGFDVAHAELPDLTSSNGKEGVTLERQRTLVQLCLRVEGPFLKPADS